MHLVAKGLHKETSWNFIFQSSRCFFWCFLLLALASSFQWGFQGWVSPTLSLTPPQKKNDFFGRVLPFLGRESDGFNKHRSSTQITKTQWYLYTIHTWNQFVPYFLKTRSFPIKTGVIWVPGIYIYMNIYTHAYIHTYTYICEWHMYIYDIYRITFVYAQKELHGLDLCFFWYSFTHAPAYGICSIQASNSKFFQTRSICGETLFRKDESGTWDLGNWWSPKLLGCAVALNLVVEKWNDCK